uniref:Dynein heavy chain AAA module D4 domain-containing protein n=1 Tax=Timema monikensis TaxID=170555 RepID=A0A7R9E7L4_9NEOP|nr:unnamed protein product [Timema monikensis]
MGHTGQDSTSLDKNKSPTNRGSDSTPMLGCTMFEITLSRGYGEAAFKEDMKKMYNQLGVANKPTVFLFTAAQVAEEGFLEMINNILMIGMIPALFSEDEKDQIVGQVRSAAVQAGYQVTKESVWQYFVNMCTDNLHVVLAMSPAGDILRTRCRNFPGLVNNTCIDWYFPWPEQALIAVANVFLAENPKIPEPYRKVIVAHVVYVHETVGDYTIDYLLKLRRKNYVTPKHYLDYIQTYLKLLDEMNHFIVAQSKEVKGAKSIGLDSSWLALAPILSLTNTDEIQDGGALSPDEPYGQFDQTKPTKRALLCGTEAFQLHPI